jgi:hypothetical protein
MDSTEKQKQFNVEITEAGISFCVAMSQFNELTDVLRELFDDGPREEIQTHLQGCSTLCDAIDARGRVMYAPIADRGRAPNVEQEPQWLASHFLIYRSEEHLRIGEIRASRGVTNDDVIAETASHEIPLQWEIGVLQAGRIIARPKTRDVLLPEGERIQFRMSVHALKELLGFDASSEGAIEVGELTSPLLPFFPLNAPKHPPLPKQWGFWADVEVFQRQIFYEYLQLRQRSSRPPPASPLLG